MKLRIIILLFMLPAFALAQTLKGRVYRAGTDSVIIGASIYFNNTMDGTVSDANGNFEFKARPIEIPLIVSCIGYFSAIVNYKPGELLTVKLKPKIEELNTVVIRADGMARKDEAALFFREFIGKSDLARSCTIINLDDIELFFNKKTQTLTARCEKPIIIENRALGYIITCYLDKFESSHENIVITGNYLFKETQDIANNDKVLSNRERAYNGSRMQFIRALWHRQLDKNDFKIYNQYNFPLTENLILRDSLRQIYIHWKGKIRINDTRVTTLTSLEDYSFIDQSGFYSAGLQWAGYLGQQRIGDMLPLEFRSKTEIEHNVNNKDTDIKQAKADNSSTNVVMSVKSPGDFDSISAAQKTVHEKAFIHTDRSLYFSGDTLWFKAYLTNASNNILLSGICNLHVDLISPDGKIAKSELIRLADGTGSGDFFIPDTAVTGQYRLRAYTNYLANLGDTFIYEKPISVINTDPPPDAGFAPIKKKLENSRTNPVAQKLKPVINTRSFTVRFYPEGGTLVNGFGSLIAIKSEDALGRGVPVKGIILSPPTDTVTRFYTDSMGLGLVTLIPLEGKTYQASVRYHDRDYKFDITAINKGVTLHVKESGEMIQVAVNDNTDIADTSSRPKYSIVVKHKDEVLINHSLTADDFKGLIKISTQGIPVGISVITLYDRFNKPRCERLIYINHEPDLNPSVEIGKTTYAPGEQAVMQISGLPKAHLSIAVVDSRFVKTESDDILTYLTLQSELNDPIENASKYLDITNENRFKQMDLLLMTQGRRDFIWPTINDTARKIKYLPENGITVSGIVKDEVNGKVLPGLHLTLFADGAKGNKLFSTLSDAKGRFSFSGLFLYGIQNIKLSAINGKGDNKGSFTVDTIAQLPVKQLAAPLTDPDTLADPSIAIDIKKEIEHKRFLKKNILLKEVKITTQPLKSRDGKIHMTWGDPKVYDITAKDLRYKTLTWYLLANVAGAMASNSPEIPGVMFVAQGRLASPVLIVNGKELYALDREEAEMQKSIYYNMLINKVKRVVVQPLVHGTLLLLTLYPDALTDNPGRLVSEVTGYYQSHGFHQIVKDDADPANDLQRTIYWQPDIQTDASGKATFKFNTLDDKSTYKIIIEGVTAEGDPIYLTKDYVVN